MKIIGDIKSANKFYIINSSGNIEWVPNIEVAKRYVTNPKNLEWYNKDIYATNEDIVRDANGRIKLSSQVDKPAINIYTITTAFKNFKQQTEEYIADLLQKYAKKYDYDSIVSMVSYNNSTVEQYKLDAEKAIDYRDRLYTYHYAFINDLDTKIKNNDAGITDFVLNYQNYLKGLPKEESEQEEGN